jgi:PAS domain S-box-containing protein
MLKTPNILIVEDSPKDAELMVYELRRTGFAFEWQRVQTEGDFIAHLDPAPDVILSDYSMPGFNGLQAVELLRKRGLDIPFILISGTVGEDVAVEAMKRGATDYLLKDRLTRLRSAIERALEQTRFQNERRRVGEALRESERLLRLVIDLVPHFIFAKDAQSRHLFANRACAEASGLVPEQMVGRSDLDLVADRAQAEAFMRDDREVIASGKARFIPEERFTDRTGQMRILQTVKIPFIAPHTGERAVLGVAVDITERKQAEEALSQRAAELERFHRLSVGRELQMIELKKEINELSRQAGRPPPYDLSFLEASRSSGSSRVDPPAPQP